MPDDFQNNISAALNLEEARRQLEELEGRLLVSEERFRTLVEATTDWIWETDANFVCTYSNPKILEVSGYTPEEVLGSAPLDLILMKGTRFSRDEFNAARGTGRPFNQIELNCRHKNGRHIVLEISGVPILSDNGIPRGWRGIARDITRKAEGARLQQTLEEIINQNDTLVVVWGIDTDQWPVEFISGNVTSILGYSSDDFLSGRVSWPGITHPDDNPRLELETTRHLKQGDRKWSQEYRLITKSGGIKWFRDNNIAFTSTTGQITNIQAVIHDITERKKIEEERKLIDNRIRQAQEDEQKKVAGAIHDISGSMLVGLSSSLLLVEEELKRGGVNNAIGKLHQTRTLVKNMVEMMKNVSADIWPPNLEIAGLSGALAAFFTQVGSYSKIKISHYINIPDDWEKYHARAGIVVYRLAQETLSNAIKHSGAKNLKVVINCDNDILKFSINDDGCGFEIDKVRSESCYGLEIMREQVKSIGGSILITSKPGRGTAIEAEFPPPVNAGGGG
ncbi:MAG: PAS domain S-box protein [Elusimicrobiota bacterium]